MKSRHFVIAALLAANFAASAQAQGVACNVKLNVIDPDPAGLNVRTSPGGAVMRALKGRGRWVEVHVSGQIGEWARIDDAQDIDEGSGQARPLFHGQGYVAIDKLGTEALSDVAFIQEAPSPGARTLLKITQSEQPKPTSVTVLGCSGDYLKVRLSTIVGWTRNFCSNRLTTCA
ncbi:MAG TPA: hypothetical protein VGI95_11285 [Caulobacteraceae bacterium]|jgi:hypothetical protein